MSRRRPRHFEVERLELSVERSPVPQVGLSGILKRSTLNAQRSTFNDNLPDPPEGNPPQQKVGSHPMAAVRRVIYRFRAELTIEAIALWMAAQCDYETKIRCAVRNRGDPSVTLRSKSRFGGGVIARVQWLVIITTLASAA